MEDKKSTAIVAGVLVGAAIVGAAIAIHHCKSREADAVDIDDIVEKARTTVQRLDEAVDILRKSAGERLTRRA
jgi:hypothetical protein